MTQPPRIAEDEDATGRPGVLSERSNPSPMLTPPESPTQDSRCRKMKKTVALWIVASGVSTPPPGPLPCQERGSRRSVSPSPLRGGGRGSEADLLALPPRQIRCEKVRR